MAKLELEGEGHRKKHRRDVFADTRRPGKFPRKEMTEEKRRGRVVVELITEVLKDRVFYEESGGGVTVSGGEPLQQPKSLRAFLHRCRREHLHTAVDTCLHAPRNILEEILAFTDLFLCDVKHIDNDKHRRWT